MNEAQIVCEVCGELVDENKYRKHISNGHKDKREFKCDLCQKEFTSNYNLQYHMAHHINARNFVCNECPRAYNTQADLVQHQRAHEMQRDPYKCEECGMTFQIKSRYKTHLRTHKNEQKGPQECTICKKTVKQLKRHFDAVHLNIRNHECEFCFKKFNKKSGKTRHISIVHEGQRNFFCDVCNKAFGEKSLLTRHKQRHMAIKTRHYCAICKKYVGEIREHYDTIHSDLNFSCEFCFRRFAKQCEYSNHIAIRHTKLRKWLCDYCGKGFAEKYQLTRHFRSHINMNENICMKEMQKLSKLSTKEIDTHLKRKKFICDLCGSMCKKRFQIIQHLKEHLKINCSRTTCTEAILIKKEPMEICNVVEYLPNFEYLSPKDTLIKSESESDCDTIVCDNNQSLSPDYIKEEYLNHEGDEFEIKSQNFIAEHENDAPFERIKNNVESRHHQNTKLTFMCSFCGKILMNERNLKMHIAAIHSQNRCECDVCKKSFTYKSAMYRHRQREHGIGKIHECDVCKIKVGTKYELNIHKNRHHNKNRDNIKPDLICFECGNNFLTQFALSRHQKRIHGKNAQERIRECEICLEVFKDPYWKKKHVAQVHLDGKKTKRFCGYCKTEFQFFDDLKLHIASHEGIFICLICGDPFLDSEALAVHSENHKKIEINLRKYQCDHCGHRLFTKVQLSLHMLKHVKNHQLHYCDICGKGFKFASSLYTHRKYHAEGELVCVFCGKAFVRNSDLKNHQRLHTNAKPYKCRICDKSFAIKQLLTFHLQTHPETRVFLKCNDCDLSFSDKQQLRRHDEQEHPERRPFFCFICNMSFKYEHNLKKHNSHKHK